MNTNVKQKFDYPLPLHLNEDVHDLLIASGYTLQEQDHFYAQYVNYQLAKRVTFNIMPHIKVDVFKADAKQKGWYNDMQLTFKTKLDLEQMSLLFHSLGVIQYNIVAQYIKDNSKDANCEYEVERVREVA